MYVVVRNDLFGKFQTEIHFTESQLADATKSAKEIFLEIKKTEEMNRERERERERDEGK
jgi:hypothetical protein